MPEDLFCIVIAVAVGVASLAFLVQAGVVLAFYKSIRKIQQKASTALSHISRFSSLLGPTYSCSEGQGGISACFF